MPAGDRENASMAGLICNVNAPGSGRIDAAGDDTHCGTRCFAFGQLMRNMGGGHGRLVLPIPKR